MKSPMLGSGSWERPRRPCADADVTVMDREALDLTLSILVALVTVPITAILTWLALRLLMATLAHVRRLPANRELA